MEWVWVSALLLGSVLVWGFVRVLELVTAWQLLQQLQQEQHILESFPLVQESDAFRQALQRQFESATPPEHQTDK